MCAGDACWALGLLFAVLTRSGHHLETPTSSTEWVKTTKGCLGSTSSSGRAKPWVMMQGSWGTNQDTQQR